MLNSRTLRSAPESGQRAGYDGNKRKKGGKLHIAVDTLGHLIALHVIPASIDDRTQVGRLAAAVQAVTGDSIDLAYVDQGYIGHKPAAAAEKQGIKLEVVKLQRPMPPRFAAHPHEGGRIETSRLYLTPAKHDSTPNR